MNTTKLAQLVAICGYSLGCGHHQLASVLPKGSDKYEVIGEGASEQVAYQNAESEARYTCSNNDKQLKVIDQHSTYQGASKDDKDKVSGGNVALAIFTGRSGKEANSDDYKVTLVVECS